MNENLRPVTTLPPFKRLCMTIGELPTSYLETMSYYEMLVWFTEYMKNTVIPTINNNGLAVEELQNKYIELKNYVDNYFNNLDVQEEINNKLDEMTEDGSLTNLIKNYVDPIYEAYEDEINNEITTFKSSVNSEINTFETTVNGQITNQNTEISNFKTTANSQIAYIDNKVSNVMNGSPTPVSSISDMTDTTKTYILTTDGYWYYYDGTDWVQGGIYQASQDNDDITLNTERINSMTNISDYNIFNPFTCKNNKELNYSGVEATNNDRWISDYIDISQFSTNYLSMVNGSIFRKFEFDENKDYLEYTTNLQVSNASTKYIRLVFNKSSVLYENRINIILYPRRSSPMYMRESYLVIPNKSIKSQSIALDKLENQQEIIDNFINNNIKFIGVNQINKGNRFDDYGNIITSTNRCLILTPYKFKKYTQFKITSTYDFAIFFYTNPNNYISSNCTGKTSYNLTRYLLMNDSYIGIEIKRRDTATLTTDDYTAISQLLEINYNYPSISYYGEKINLNKNVAKYHNIGVDSLFYYQDGCVFENELFSFNADGNVNVIDLPNKSLISSFVLPANSSDVQPHCNSACFGKLKYDDSDKYPLLYVNYYQSGSYNKCAVYRITRSEDTFTGTYLYDITIENGGTCNFAIDTDNNYLYTVSPKNDNNLTKITKYNVPSQSATLTDNDILDSFTVPLERTPQGLQYYDSKLYQVCGIESSSSGSANLYVIDLVNKNECSKMYLGGILNEPEVSAIYDGKFICGLRYWYFQ